MTVLPSRLIDLDQLQQELQAADVPLMLGLTIFRGQLYIVGSGGRLDDLPPNAQAVLAAHVPGNPARDRVTQLAQTAVGALIDDLTAAQRNALLVVLLYRAGGLDRTTMKVKPLGAWAL
jgi:hypothetical protein